MSHVLLALRKLCGLGEGRIVGFHFEAGPVTAVAVGLILLAAAACWGIGWLYWSEASRLGRRQRAWLTALRVVALLVAALILVRPTLTTESSTASRPRAVILVDTSHSMRITGERTEREARTTTTRWQRARPVLEELARRMAESFRMECYGFDESARLLFASAAAEGDPEELADRAREALRKLDPQGPVTALGDALSEVLRGPPPDLVVVVSDGASNRGRSPILAAQRAREKAVRLLAAPVGGEGRKDVGIARFDLPTILPKGESANLRVFLQQNGYSDQEATVVFREDDAELDRKTVRLTRRVVDVPLSFTPKVEGEFTYSVEVLTLEEELTGANNRWVQKAVVEDETARVLLADRRPRWEWRFALAALLRDKRIDRSGTRAYLAEADAGADPQLFIESFPDSLQALSAYDVVVLGDLAPSLPRTGDRGLGAGAGRMPWEAVRDFVEKQGGGLILLAGPHHMPQDYGQTPLAPLLPVRRLLSNVAGRPFQLQRTPNPISRALFSMPGAGGEPTDEPVPLDATLHRAFLGLAHSLAEPLAVHSTLKYQGAPLPVLLLRRYGKGRVLYIGTDDLWRLRGPRTHRWHDHFWVQAVLHAGQQKILGGTPHLELHIAQRWYLPGEPIRVEGEALAEDFSPSQAEFIQVTIRNAAGDQAVVRQGNVTADRAQPGRFAGTLAAPEREGTYILEARDPVSERTRQLWVHVVTTGPEYEDTRCDRQLLRQVAAAAGGEYCELEGLIDAFGALEAREEKATVTRQVPLWDSGLVYLLLLTALTLEWIQRRRADLL